MTQADAAARAQLVRLTYGYMTSQMIRTAVELRIPELLRDGPRDSVELASLSGTHPPSLHRLLRALVAFGVLTEPRPATFATAPMGTLLDHSAPGRLTDIAGLFCGSEFWQSWSRLTHSITTGEAAFDTLHGTDFYSYIADNPRFAHAFRSAMAANAAFEAPFIADGYDFSPYRTLVDVGGGDGTLLAALLERHPGVRGIVLETPAMAERARERLAEVGLAGRTEVVAGDFFDKVPEDGDGYLLKSVLHNWNDARAVDLLRTCRASMDASDSLLIIEPVLPSAASESVCVETAFSDLNMLVLTAGGFERTEAQLRHVLGTAGFEAAEISPVIEATDFRVVRGRPVPR
ncbi:acetylserotonin O-methyltransferase [Streptomyces huiliensis]|uniref:acetylserotonin O-methyltransferase n=1 Tax=Streptomyces huiliensis TaxID=2876027 RepID=UPI001CC07417|nr:acetylserotonin O-methyltransferase [Streptomyces huiliensis]MBZ4317862.1 methyltransferase [Streptomyces huiliensis]